MHRIYWWGWYQLGLGDGTWKSSCGNGRLVTCLATAVKRLSPSKQLLFDSHLRSRGFYETVEHDVSTGMPPLPYSSRPWKFSLTPGGARTAAPTMGKHNRHVLAERLGMSDEEIGRLEDSGAIGARPTSLRPPRIVPLEEQLERGLIISYEDDYKEQLRRHYG